MFRACVYPKSVYISVWCMHMSVYDCLLVASIRCIWLDCEVLGAVHNCICPCSLIYMDDDLCKQL